MIAAEGYSKEPTIMPESIVITWGSDMLWGKGMRPFIRYFREIMIEENSLWMDWCKNPPQHDIIYVYIIVLNRLKYRCYYAGHETGETKMWNDDGTYEIISKPRILMAGPFERCPFKRELRGFQS